jgi:hypothetical protein
VGGWLGGGCYLNAFWLSLTRISDDYVKEKRLRDGFITIYQRAVLCYWHAITHVSDSHRKTTVSGAAQCLKTSVYLHNVEGWFCHEFASGRVIICWKGAQCPIKYLLSQYLCQILWSTQLYKKATFFFLSQDKIPGMCVPVASPNAWTSVFVRAGIYSRNVGTCVAFYTASFSRIVFIRTTNLEFCSQRFALNSSSFQFINFLKGMFVLCLWYRHLEFRL